MTQKEERTLGLDIIVITLGPKYKARYWSCKFWSTKSVSDLMKG